MDDRRHARGPLSQRCRSTWLPPLRLVCVVGGIAVFCGVSGAQAVRSRAASPPLPDAPGALLYPRLIPARIVEDAQSPAADPPQMGLQGAPQLTAPSSLPKCKDVHPGGSPDDPVDAAAHDRLPPSTPCVEEDPLQLVLSSSEIRPLNGRQKAMLAVRDIKDPFNLITVAANSAIFVASNAHSAYGPGFEGFGRATGYSMVQDVQGEFIGTFLIPTLAHEDPRYHRMPGKPVPVRIFHALAHTVVSNHDDGRTMVNLATLLTYPIAAELSNLYVPGVATNAASTTRRIALGLATDPSGALIAEFLPDVAKHIHIRVVFVQQLLNQVAVGSPSAQ